MGWKLEKGKIIGDIGDIGELPGQIVLQGENDGVLTKIERIEA